MSDATRSLRKLGDALLARPDEMMLEIGATGELLVARIRVVVAGLLLLLPLVNNLAGGTVAETLIGLAGAVTINVFAQVWLVLARRRRRFRWLPFATTTFDVTITTAVLVALAHNHLPSGLNSMVVWCGYVLAILVTALRSDGRTTLLAGALAVGQYGLLVAVVFLVAGSPERLISAEYGAVTVGNQVQRLILLAVAAAITMMVVYRMQRLVEMSGTDGLTRLPNRTWLMHRLPQMLDVVKRDGGSLSVAMLDLDHFKRINDELGQHAGDRALRHVVTSLRVHLEQGEQLVRLSGAEFVMVLRKPVGTAWERVDAIRRMLLEHPFEAERGGMPRRITFSAGIAGFPQDGQDLSRLLRRADQRLQTAKLEGRNRVVARDG
ncbi:GGDEF domain-containing protein [Aerolutibacter ruishenii]|uniref:diguanylate cyclase n=1 Tax=Aerolutibacter ruishenii TaxID=686800 RepID=A0A562LNM2_9GAMM|nr:GGDEF domain-containing protein [Lysobacter ruishenii]TWI09173.1 diguanylate cyclase (GGDEF)-like protein [Lysobacter ruishenii]